MTYLINVKGILVGISVQQSVHLRGVVDLNLGNPGLALRIFVDGLGLVVQKRVTLQYLAGNGGEDVRGGLDRLYGSDGLTCAEFDVRGGELDEDDITEGLGGVFGDSNLGYMGRNLQSVSLVACLLVSSVVVRHDNAMGK